LRQSSRKSPRWRNSRTADSDLNIM
jgi:hypothetical protein